jgi:hypothetical protein
VLLAVSKAPEHTRVLGIDRSTDDMPHRLTLRPRHWHHDREEQQEDEDSREAHQCRGHYWQ